jgi:creatinine amidohydrolase
MGKSVLWQEMRRGEIEEMAKAGGVVIVPVGSVEQHGPHLPLDVDIFDAWTIAQRAAERLQSFPVVVAPPVWWGLSGFHMGYAGSLTLRLETFTALVDDICTSIQAHGFKKIVLLNGHGGNMAFIRAAVIKLAAQGIPAAAVTYWDLIPKEMATISETDGGGIGHAGEMETSLQLYLRPHLVEKTLISPNIKNSMDGPQKRGILGLGAICIEIERDFPGGVEGDPTTATAAKGEQIVEASVAALIRYLEAYRALPTVSTR